MKTLILKISVVSVAVLLLAILLFAFWPKQEIESGKTKPNTASVVPSAKKAQPDKFNENKAGDSAIEQEKPEELLDHAKKIYEAGNADNLRYLSVMNLCSKVIEQSPDSTEAEQAKELISKIPQQYQEQYEEEMKLFSKPAVRKSRPLRTRRRRPINRPGIQIEDLEKAENNNQH